MVPLSSDAQRLALVGYRLLDAEAAVEVAGLEQSLLRVGDVQGEVEEEHQHAAGGPEQALPPAVGPGDGEREQGGDEEGDGEIVVGREEKRAGDADEEGSGDSAGGYEEIEERGLGGAAGAQGVGFGVAEEAGDEALEEKEEDGDADGEAAVDLGDGVAEAGEHDDHAAGRRCCGGRGGETRRRG